MATQVVDHSALKVNQTGIIATVLVAFIGSAFYRPALFLIPLLAIVLLLGTFAPQPGAFQAALFQGPEAARHRQAAAGAGPARAAQLRPGARRSFPGSRLPPFSASAAVVIGLALALLVAVLAFVNLAFGYCLGCQIYFQLGKRGLIRAS